MALLSPPEADAPLLEPVEPVDPLDMLGLVLPVEPPVAPEDDLPVDEPPVDEPLDDGVLVLEPAVEPVLVPAPVLPPDVCAMARPMARVALSAIRVFFIRDISCLD